MGAVAVAHGLRRNIARWPLGWGSASLCQCLLCLRFSQTPDWEAVLSLYLPRKVPCPAALLSLPQAPASQVTSSALSCTLWGCLVWCLVPHSTPIFSSILGLWVTFLSLEDCSELVLGVLFSLPLQCALNPCFASRVRVRTWEVSQRESWCISPDCDGLTVHGSHLFPGWNLLTFVLFNLSCYGFCRLRKWRGFSAQYFPPTSLSVYSGWPAFPLERHRL